MTSFNEVLESSSPEMTITENLKMPLTMPLPPPPLSWTLDKRDAEDSIFLKKRMREYAPITKIKGFLKNNMGISFAESQRFKHLVFNKISTEQDQLNGYKELYMPSKGYYRVQHTLPKHKWGRIIPKGYLSLSVFHRPTRHALCQNDYVDIDMKNAQPQIVYEMCRQYGIQDSVSALKDYCDDPKKFRQIIMEHHNVSYDTAKKLPIRIMFGGSYGKWMEECDVVGGCKLPLFVTLENQMTLIIDKVYVANPQIEKDVLKVDKDKWKTLSPVKTDLC